MRRTNAGLPKKIHKNLSFLRDPNKDVESLLPGGLTMIRTKTPRSGQAHLNIWHPFLDIAANQHPSIPSTSTTPFTYC